ncbi:MAG: hypothetical protein QOJ73_4355 [Streptosporangiaceae bacterium]|jgi:hypothetical protein|nr:hypothetical protein [Streptosporangiaceae bacterium]
MPPAVAPVVAALRTKRLGQWRRHDAALGTSGAGARLLCAEARVGAVVARGAGGAVAPVHRYYLE